VSVWKKSLGALRDTIVITSLNAVLISQAGASLPKTAELQRRPHAAASGQIRSAALQGIRTSFLRYCSGFAALGGFVYVRGDRGVFGGIEVISLREWFIIQPSVLQMRDNKYTVAQAMASLAFQPTALQITAHRLLLRRIRAGSFPRFYFENHQEL
jgi:hypothetical protein